MTKRAMKIGKEIVNRMYENGGHWLELQMKNGDKLYIQRCGFASYERLQNEKFNIKQNGTKVLSQVELDELASFIDSQF